MTTPHLIQRVCHRVGYATRADSGFTLVEVVVAFAIFMGIAGSALYSVVTGLNAQSTTQNGVGAVNLASSQIQTLRALPQRSLQSMAQQATTGSAAAVCPNSSTGTSVVYATVGNGRFTVCRTVSATCVATSSNTPHGAYQISFSVLVTPPGSTGGSPATRPRSVAMNGVVAC